MEQVEPDLFTTINLKVEKAFNEGCFKEKYRDYYLNINQKFCEIEEKCKTKNDKKNYKSFISLLIDDLVNIDKHLLDKSNRIRAIFNHNASSNNQVFLDFLSDCRISLDKLKKDKKEQIIKLKNKKRSSNLQRANNNDNIVNSVNESVVDKKQNADDKEDLNSKDNYKEDLNSKDNDKGDLNSKDNYQENLSSKDIYQENLSSKDIDKEDLNCKYNDKEDINSKDIDKEILSSKDNEDSVEDNFNVDNGDADLNKANDEMVS